MEHRLFCYISKNWQGKPLIDVETAIELIGSTTTNTGLKVICQRDDNVYELAIAVSDEDFESLDSPEFIRIATNPWKCIENSSIEAV